MEKFPEISIIIPVFKAEKYLSKCIESILNQTFSNFEVLLIDDGSPDMSGSICDDYQKKDKRVRVFHKKNGGVSSARQCGIDNAHGVYTIHVDPDDWVEPNMLFELYCKAKEDKSDMVLCDYYVNFPNKQKYITQRPSALQHDVVLKDLFNHLHGSCCNKLIRLSCYKDFNVSFPLDLNCREDLFVVASIVTNNIKISYINKAYYHYVQCINDNSLVSNEKVEMIELLKEKLQGIIPSSIFLEYVCPSLDLSVAKKLLLDYSVDNSTYRCKIKPNLKSILNSSSLIWNSIIFLSYYIVPKTFICRLFYLIFSQK